LCKRWIRVNVAAADYAAADYAAADYAAADYAAADYAAADYAAADYAAADYSSIRVARDASPFAARVNSSPKGAYGRGNDCDPRVRFACSSRGLAYWSHPGR
jgi:hypothetical protein